MPGTSVFQRMPSWSVHLTGTFLSEALPEPLGPRKRGQSEAEAGTITKLMRTSIAKNLGVSVCMLIFLLNMMGQVPNLSYTTGLS